MLKFFLVAVLGWVLVGAGEPDVVYLTWIDDPTTTMTVVWQGGDASRVLFQPLGESKWMSTTADSHAIKETPVIVYVAHIQGLKSGMTYVFKIEGSQRQYRFRTLPTKLKREVRFVVGGDLFYYWGTELFQRMNRAVAYDDPDFVVLGGDLAYTISPKTVLKGRQWEAGRWQEFLRQLQKTLHGKEGRMIPILPVVGNHDVRKGSQNSEMFYEVFPFPEKGKAYRSLQIGDYLDFVLLDTGHTWPIDGDQTEWLKTTLEKSEAPYVFAAYHVGAYPSVYKFKGATPQLLRKTWVPLFEEAHLCAAFEHHSHALKRTYPIRQEQKDRSGVIYLGDGSWGVPPRKAHSPKELWYLEKSASVNACWFVHLTQQKATIEARTETGEVADAVTIFPREVLVGQ